MPSFPKKSQLNYIEVRLLKQNDEKVLEIPRTMLGRCNENFSVSATLGWVKLL